MQQFPALYGGNNFTNERLLDEEEVGEDVVPCNPIERKNAKIAELQKDVAEIPALKESLVKVKAELKAAKTNDAENKKKINFARRVTEERLKECLPIPNFEADHSKVLITLMSTLVDEENFEMDPNTETFQPKDDFLREVEESIDRSSDEQVVKQRLELVKNKLVERFKESKSKGRERRNSICSTSSQDSNKRKAPTELHNNKEAVRSKLASFLPKPT